MEGTVRSPIDNATKYLGQRILHTYNNENVEKQRRLTEEIFSFDPGLGILDRGEEKKKLMFHILTLMTHDEGLAINRAIFFDVDEKQNKLVGKIGIGPENEASAQKSAAYTDLSPSMYECFGFYDKIDQYEGLPRKICDLVFDLNDPKWKEIIAAPERVVFDLTPQLFSNDSNKLILNKYELKDFYAMPLRKDTTGKVYGVIIGDNVYSRRPLDALDRQMLLLIERQLVNLFQQSDFVALQFVAIEDLKDVKNALGEIMVKSQIKKDDVDKINGMLCETIFNADRSNS